MHKDSIPLSLNSALFRRRCGISDLTYIIRPPLEEVLSCLNGFYPCALNCASGKLSSSLDSLMARKSALWLDKSSCKCANLCLKLLMFTCVNTKLWWWVCLKSDMILKKPPVSFSKPHSFSVQEWFLACSAPSHHLHRCQRVVNCKVKNDSPCNMREKWRVLLLYEIIEKMSSVEWRHLYRPQFAKWMISYHPDITLRHVIST